MNLWNCFLRNWIWPLLALLLLYFAMMSPFLGNLGNKWRHIESDVASRVKNSLSSQGLDWAEVNTHDRGRDVILSGVAPSEDDKNRAMNFAVLATDDHGKVAARKVQWQGSIKPHTPIAYKDTRFNASLRDGKISISGVMADQAQIDALLASASAKFGSQNVSNRLTIGENVTPLQNLGKTFAGFELEIGQLSVTGKQVNLVGQVASDSEKATVASNVAASLGSDYIVSNRISVIVPEPVIEPIPEPVAAELPQESLACQQQLLTLMSSSQIFFETASDKIKADSYAVLQQIVSILQQCPDAVIEISGHTDSTGNEEQNRALSNGRASSVLNYLVNKEIAAEKLAAVGYGSSQPIGDNGTQEGRAKNRRIEFTIK